MAYTDLEQFLRHMSIHASLRQAFAKDPDQVMTDAGLSDEEKKLVMSGDVDEIKCYLGDAYSAAIAIRLE